MNRYTFGSVCAGALAMSVAMNAQTPAQPRGTATTATTATQAAQTAAGAVTIEGCLMREADVPGRKPSVPERTGVMEDFIITQVKMVKGTAPRGVAVDAPSGTPIGTSGTASTVMYRVEGLSADTLKSQVNKRVQLDGMFAVRNRVGVTASSTDLMDIRALTIRPVPGECPAK